MEPFEVGQQIEGFRRKLGLKNAIVKLMVEFRHLLMKRWNS